MHCWRECKGTQLWRMVGWSLRKLCIELYDPAIPCLGIYTQLLEAQHSVLLVFVTRLEHRLRRLASTCYSTSQLECSYISQQTLREGGCHLSSPRPTPASSQRRPEGPQHQPGHRSKAHRQRPSCLLVIMDPMLGAGMDRRGSCWFKT